MFRGPARPRWTRVGRAPRPLRRADASVKRGFGSKGGGTGRVNELRDGPVWGGAGPTLSFSTAAPSPPGPSARTDEWARGPSRGPGRPRDSLRLVSAVAASDRPRRRPCVDPSLTPRV